VRVSGPLGRFLSDAAAGLTALKRKRDAVGSFQLACERCQLRRNEDKWPGRDADESSQPYRTPAVPQSGSSPSCPTGVPLTPVNAWKFAAAGFLTRRNTFSLVSGRNLLGCDGFVVEMYRVLNDCKVHNDDSDSSTEAPKQIPTDGLAAQQCVAGGWLFRT